MTTVELTVTVVVASVILGLLIALLLDRKFWGGRGIVRTMLIAPFLVVPVASALVFKHAIYNPEYGLLNGTITWVWGGLFGGDTTPPQPDWISSFPLLSIQLNLIWQWTPFMMLILLAGLQGRPLDVIEAARIDGAGSWQIFRSMTLPHLRQYIELGGAARVDLRGPELRRRVHDHLGRARHGQPAVHDLHDVLQRAGLRAGLGRRGGRGDRDDHHRDVRAAHRLQPVP